MSLLDICGLITLASSDESVTVILSSPAAILPPNLTVMSDSIQDIQQI